MTIGSLIGTIRAVGAISTAVILRGSNDPVGRSRCWYVLTSARKPEWRGAVQVLTNWLSRRCARLSVVVVVIIIGV